MNVRRSVSLLGAAAVSLLLGCASDQPLAPSEPEIAAFSAAASQSSKAPATPGPSDQACWGQATAVFARMGEMGEHSSSFAGDPRLGLRNLARALYEQGVIEDDTLQALGAFVAAELGLSIDACM